MQGSWEAPVCFYYQQGNCRFGESCHYRHQQAPGVSLDSICWYYQENGWCPHGRSCNFIHNPTVSYYPVPPLSKRSSDQSVCIFYQRGGCRRGNNCSFLHPGAPGDESTSSASFSRTAKTAPSHGRNFSNTTQRNTQTLKESQETCDAPEAENETEKNDEQNHTTNAVTRNRRRRRPKATAREEKENNATNAETSTANDSSPVEGNGENEEEKAPEELAKLPALTPEQCLAAQSRERKTLKQRIASDNLTVKTNAKGEEYYEFEFSSTDPDWSYDFKSVLLRISFPEDYPSVSMKAKCLPSDVLPDSITSTCNKAINQWLTQRMENIGRTSATGDLTFRPFLRWLDRRLEGIFTEGLKEYKKAMVLKASGISIWTPDKLRRALGHDSDEETTDAASEAPPSPEKAPIASEEADADCNTEKSEEKANAEQIAAVSDVRPSGVELRLRNLQLGEQTASVTFSRLRLMLQCDRCRHPAELTLTASQGVSAHCERCNNDMLAVFRPALVHAFSPIIGYLDGGGCRPIDAAFVEWKYNVVCLNCNRGIDRLNIRPGVLDAFKCIGCFKELRVGFNAVQFNRLAESGAPIDATNVQRIVSLKPKKVPKDPAIREGFPLPHEGTCKHYKKSHRWLRFPCCGRTFPCDVCHDEAVTDGHEMAFANRMICGFCCKEQPFSSERPCSGCHKSLTKTRSSYWEGGKGCRDKTAMSRNDSKKYANHNKTVSRKSQKQ